MNVGARNLELRSQWERNVAEGIAGRLGAHVGDLVPRAAAMIVLGRIADPRAVLIRPDGYVAWAGDLNDPTLPEALMFWIGASSSAGEFGT
jgi:hypothetical protein